MSTLTVRVDLTPLDKLKRKGQKLKGSLEKTTKKKMSEFKKNAKQEAKSRIDKI